MTASEVGDITRDRLKGWARLLVDSHATPFAVVGCGHDHNSGQVVLCIPDDVPVADIVTLLEGALVLLKHTRR